ncbi:hypothetical protein WJX82_001770 [Trebouxia sp. C0006]
MAVTGTPYAGLNRSQARREKRKLTKAAARAATPVVLAIKTVTAQLKVGRRASQYRRSRKTKWKQKARKAAVKASCGAVPQSAEDSEAGANLRTELTQLLPRRLHHMRVQQIVPASLAL